MIFVGNPGGGVFVSFGRSADAAGVGGAQSPSPPAGYAGRASSSAFTFFLVSASRFFSFLDSSTRRLSSSARTSAFIASSAAIIRAMDSDTTLSPPATVNRSVGVGVGVASSRFSRMAYFGGHTETSTLITSASVSFGARFAVFFPPSRARAATAAASAAGAPSLA